MEMVQRVESEYYSHSETLTIAMPITIPYASDSRHYEPAYGKFEHEGEFYHLVKQKLYKDTLYIVCVKDSQSGEIHRALADYVQTFRDAPLEAQSAGVKSVPTLIKDYISNSIGLKSQNEGWEEELVYPQLEELRTSRFSPSVNQPPEGLTSLS